MSEVKDEVGSNYIYSFSELQNEGVMQCYYLQLYVYLHLISALNSHICNLKCLQPERLFSHFKMTYAPYDSLFTFT